MVTGSSRRRAKNSDSGVSNFYFNKQSEDRRLYIDEADVKYCKALNSCKIPQVKLKYLNFLFKKFI